MTQKDLYTFLKEVVENYDRIFIRVKQGGKWQSLALSEITDEKDVLNWIMNARLRGGDVI